MFKTIAMLVVAIIIAVTGVKLGRYADADDSPGGVVIIWLIVAGAVVLAVKAFVRKDTKLDSKQN